MLAFLPGRQLTPHSLVGTLAELLGFVPSSQSASRVAMAGELFEEARNSWNYIESNKFSPEISENEVAT